MSSDGQTLTRFQASAQSRDVVNLATGYAGLAARSADISQLERDFHDWVASGESAYELATDTLSKAFGMADQSSLLLTTSSGSLALARTIMATAGRGRALVTGPGFDSIATLCEEATSVSPVIAKWDPFDQSADLFEAVMERLDPSISIAVIVSPDNPTNFTFTSRQLRQILDRCQEVGATLIVDQCFAFVISESTGRATPLATALPDSGDWCMLWDSGKTVQALGEKLGFISASTSLHDRVRDSLEVIQLDVPELTREVVARGIIREFSEQGHRTRSALLEGNRTLLTTECTKASHPILCQSPGGFALISLEGTKYESRSLECAVRLLSDHGVAVMPSSLLHASGVEFLRVSLSSPLEHVRMFLTALAQTV